MSDLVQQLKSAAGDYSEFDKHLEHDARLIAAAPDLLEALQAIEKYMRADFDDMPMSGKARAAIAKATIAEVSQ